VDFDTAQHVRTGKHSEQFEKAIDEVLAEEDAIAERRAILEFFAENQSLK
jgi:hypothetical protein